MFTRGRQVPPSGRRLRPTTPAPVLRSVGVQPGAQRRWHGNPAKLPYRVPDLPGGVAVNPHNPSLPALAYFRPGGVHGPAAIVRNPRARMPRDPLSNLARAILLGIPAQAMTELGGPPARVAQALAHGNLPSRQDIGNTLSMLPFGPRGDFASMPHLGPEALAAAKVEGWHVRTPRQGEKYFTWQGQPQTFHRADQWFPDAPGGQPQRQFTPNIFRNLYHHGAPVGSVTGTLKDETGAMAYNPSEVKQLHVGQMWVKELAANEMRKLSRNRSRTARASYPGAGMQLFHDITNLLRQHNLGLPNVRATFANPDLKRMAEKLASRQMGQPMKMDELMGFVPAEQWRMNLEDALHGTGIHARPNPTPFDAPATRPAVERQMTEAGVALGPHAQTTAETATRTLEHMSQAERRQLADKLAQMGEQTLPTLLRLPWDAHSPDTRALLGGWVNEALHGHGLSARAEHNTRGQAGANDIANLRRGLRESMLAGQAMAQRRASELSPAALIHHFDLVDMTPAQRARVSHYVGLHGSGAISRRVTNWENASPGGRRLTQQLLNGWFAQHARGR